VDYWPALRHGCRAVLTRTGGSYPKRISSKPRKAARPRNGNARRAARNLFEFSFGQRPGIPFTRHNDIVVCGVHQHMLHSLEHDEQADVYARTATPL
jgi:hypothetical protein